MNVTFRALEIPTKAVLRVSQELSHCSLAFIVLAFWTRNGHKNRRHSFYVSLLSALLKPYK